MNPVVVKKCSQILTEGWLKLSDDYKQYNKLTIILSDSIVDENMCDTVFIGDTPDFQIEETSDNKVYVRPCANDPTIAEEDRMHVRTPLQELNKWIRQTLSLPTPCYYGGYFDTFEEALINAISWTKINPIHIPKCYNPPIRPRRG